MKISSFKLRSYFYLIIATLLISLQTKGQARGEGSPTFISFSTTAPDGQYNTGDVIRLEGKFDDWLGVGSEIKVRLNTGDIITMTFDPKVAEDFIDPDWGVPGVRNATLGNHARTYGVYCITELANNPTTKGRFIIAGGFNNYEGSGQNDIVVTDHNGLLLQGFDSQFNQQVHWVEETLDGGFIAGGQFTNYGGNANYDYLVKFKYDAAQDKFVVDTDFMNNLTANNTRPALNNVISVPVATYGKPQRGIQQDADGSIYIIGGFTSVGGVTRRALAKLNADGTLNTEFNPSGITYGRTISFDPDLDAVGHIWVGASNSIYRIDKTTGAIINSRSIGFDPLAITVLPNTDVFDNSGNPGADGIIVTGRYGTPTGGWLNLIAFQNDLSITPMDKFALGKNNQVTNSNLTAGSWAVDGAAFLKGKMWLGLHEASFHNRNGNYYEGALIVLNYDGSLNTDFNNMLAVRSNTSTQDGIGGPYSGGGTDIISLYVTSEDDLMVGGSFGSIMQYTDDAAGTSGAANANPDDQFIIRINFRRAVGYYTISADDMVSGLKIVEIIDHDVSGAFGEPSGSVSMDNIQQGDEFENNHKIGINMPYTIEAEKFITTWKTTSNNEKITIPTINNGYDFIVDWGITKDENGDGIPDGNIPVITRHTSANMTTNPPSYTYKTPGTYTIKIMGGIDADGDGYSDGTGFPCIAFKESVDADKILTIEQWGNIKWDSMNGAFEGCVNLDCVASDTPDLSKQGIDLSAMFLGCSKLVGTKAFNNWDVSKVAKFQGTFSGAKLFNQPIGNWTVSGANFMAGMFDGAETFNQDLSNWNVSNVINMAMMFRGATAFNQNLSSWNISKVTMLNEMFKNATSFNNGDPGNNGARPLTWTMKDGANITSGSFWNLFESATAFNQDISSWNISKGTNFNYMFKKAAAFNNGDPGNNGARPLTWTMKDGANITSAPLTGMFWEAKSFNQDISSWDVSQITSIYSMFYDAILFNNGDTSNASVKPLNWGSGTSNISNTGYAFSATAFNQDISDWDISSLTSATNMFYLSELDVFNYDALLLSWNKQVQSGKAKANVKFHGGRSKYCAGEDARKQLIDKGWGDGVSGEADGDGDYLDIVDGGVGCPFTTKWKPAGGTITIPINSTYTYNYTIQITKLDGTVLERGLGVTTAYTSSVLTENEVLVKIVGVFPHIRFNNGGDKTKITSVENWGNIEWQSMENAFYGCANLQVNATDVPDLSKVTDLSNMFRRCQVLNFDLSNWNVSMVTNFASMFREATAFNNGDTGNNGARPLNWTMKDGANIASGSFLHTFREAKAFNQNLNSWNISKGTNFTEMFLWAESFNNGDPGNNGAHPLTWTMKDGVNTASGPANGMLWSAKSFNQDISSWDVSQITSFYALFAVSPLFNNGDTNNSSSKPLTWGSNTSLVTDMRFAFQETPFNQDISDWDISSLTQADGMFYLSELDVFNYDALLLSWNKQVQSGKAKANVKFHGGKSRYCAGEDARKQLIEKGWGDGVSGEADGDGDYLDIVDGGIGCPFITKWKPAGGTITIPINSTYTYNYTIQITKLDGTVLESASGVTTAYTSSVLTEAEVVIKIAGVFPHIRFNNGGDKTKITSVENWGNIEWQSMENAFYGCANLQVNATDVPDLSKVTNLYSMFEDCQVLNFNVSNWDVSNITSIGKMFKGATAFNQDLSSWNVSKVTNFHFMFQDATAFNNGDTGNNGARPLNWIMKDGENIASGSFWGMFKGATAFNQNVSSWNISKGTNFNYLFQGATAFNNGDKGNNGTHPLTWTMKDGVNAAFGSASGMFWDAKSFNQEVSSWRVNQITNMYALFLNASLFNNGDPNNASVKPLTWGSGTSNVTSTEYAFSGTAFNQNISDWDISSLARAQNMFDGCELAVSNYDALLLSWNEQVQSGKGNANVTFHGGKSQYCAGAEARKELIDKGWGDGDSSNTPDYSKTGDLKDGGDNCSSPFITRWRNYDNASTWKIGMSVIGNDNDYDIVVRKTDGTLLSQALNNIESKTIQIPGTIKEVIVEVVARKPLHLNYRASTKALRDYLYSIEQWGGVVWKSMADAFYGCTYLTKINDTKAPNLAMVTDMRDMFNYCQRLEGANLNSWDVSKVTSMAGMFATCYVFNGQIENWEVGKVENMLMMFASARKFDRNLGSWDISSLTNADRMFIDAELSISNYDALLIGWGQQLEAGTAKKNVKFHGGRSKFCAGEPYRRLLIKEGWGDGVIGGDATDHTDPTTGIIDGGTQAASNQFSFQPDFTTCQGNTVRLTLSGSETGITYQLYKEADASPVGNPVVGTGKSIYFDVKVEQTTTYYVGATNTHCEVTFGDITVTVDPLSKGGTLKGTATVCEGTNNVKLTLEANSYTGTIIRWESSADNFSRNINVISNNKATYDATNLTQTTSYRVVVKNGVCNEALSSIVTITVNPTSVGGTLTSTSESICYNNSIKMDLAGHTGDVIHWESSRDLAFTSPTVINHTAPSYTATNLKEDTYFRVYVKNGTCDGTYSSNRLIKVSPASNGGDLSASSTSITSCAGNTAMLQLVGGTGSIVRWESSTDNFTDAANIQVINNTEDTYNTGLLTKTTWYRAIRKSGVCAEAASISAKVTVSPYVEMELTAISIASVNDGVKFTLDITNNSTTTAFAASSRAVAFYCSYGTTPLHVDALPAFAAGETKSVSVRVPNTALTSCSSKIRVVIVDDGSGVNNDCNANNNSLEVDLYSDYGDLPTGYGLTLLADGGAKHMLPGYNAANNTASLMLGTNVSSETDGTESPNASADSYDDAISFSYKTDGSGITLNNITITNNTGKIAHLYGWLGIDNGSFNNADRRYVEIPAKGGVHVVSLIFDTNTITPGNYFVRLRVGTVQSEVENIAGTASDGEVEDHMICVYPDKMNIASTSIIACPSNPIDLNKAVDPIGAYSKNYETLTSSMKITSWRIDGTDYSIDDTKVTAFVPLEHTAAGVFMVYYNVIEQHCDQDVSGTGSLYINVSDEEIQDKITKAICYDDAKSINLFSMAGFIGNGNWSYSPELNEPESIPSGALDGHIFNGHIGYGAVDGEEIEEETAFTFKYSPSAQDCFKTSIYVTIVITNSY